MSEFDDTILRAALASVRRLEATDDEVARVMKRAREARFTRRTASLIAPVLTAMVLLAGSAYALPATRGVIDDVAGTFTGWVAGNDDGAPGRPLDANDDAPSWVRSEGGRLIAKTDGFPLYVTRVKSNKGTVLGFSLGGEGMSISTFDTVEGWLDKFRHHAVVVLGALPGRPSDEGSKRFPLFGVTARSVERVELRYASGPPVVAEGVNGGFVLMADATRPLREIVVYSADGHELDRADASTYADPSARGS
jgi:hypothetical protein